MNTNIWGHFQICISVPLKDDCRKGRQIKGAIQYSVKWLVTGNEPAFYKSLYLLNGKRKTKKIGN